MNVLQSLLKQVAADPDTLVVEPSTPTGAFPGLVELNFDLKLANGFAFGDWMNDAAVSVAEELQYLDIGAPTSPDKKVACIWRIALVDGPVVLMNVEIYGREDSDFSECRLIGSAIVVEALEVAPFIAELMKQLSRVEAYRAVEKILKESSRLRKQFEAVFPDGLQRTEALQGLVQA